MIDRVIGIVGLALTFITAVLPSYFPQLPSQVPPTGFAIGIFLLGLSLGLVAAGGLRQKRPVSNIASLKLHIYGDHRTPDRLNAENIFRWFYLQTTINGFGPTGITTIGTLATLFISFENDVIISTLSVRSPDVKLPMYEIKEFNQRYAIIVFSDNVPAGTLEVLVSQ